MLRFEDFYWDCRELDGMMGVGEWGELALDRADGLEVFRFYMRIIEEGLDGNAKIDYGELRLMVVAECY